MCYKKKKKKKKKKPFNAIIWLVFFFFLQENNMASLSLKKYAKKGKGKKNTKPTYGFHVRHELPLKFESNTLV